MTDKEEAARWFVNQWTGEWIEGQTAGGCRSHLDTFALNPQYIVTLEPESDQEEEESLCTMIVSLMQLRSRRTKDDDELLSIGFVIYLLENYDTISEPLETEFFKYNLSTGRSKAFLNTREVTKRFNLPPGTYVIIPSTFEPGRQGSFLLRTFTEKQNKKQISSES